MKFSVSFPDVLQYQVTEFIPIETMDISSVFSNSWRQNKTRGQSKFSEKKKQYTISDAKLMAYVNSTS